MSMQSSGNGQDVLSDAPLSDSELKQARHDAKVSAWMMEWARDILDDPLREYNFIARRTLMLTGCCLVLGFLTGLFIGLSMA